MPRTNPPRATRATRAAQEIPPRADPLRASQTDPRQFDGTRGCRAHAECVPARQVYFLVHPEVQQAHHLAVVSLRGNDGVGDEACAGSKNFSALQHAFTAADNSETFCIV